MYRLALIFVLAAQALAQKAPAPQPMGTVATQDALVSGGLEVRDEQASLLTNASVTAYGHTAVIELVRGGEVLVCSTSQFHLLHSGTELSLLFGLDRGALEIHGESQPQDVVLTPDLRFTFATTGQLDLRLRVTSNGDTCVENRGAAAPMVAITDVFSDATYRLHPGQHVLFERGSLREVVDQERSSCGCPASIPPPVSQIAGGAPGSPTRSDIVEARNPFPAAVSQGLAPETRPSASPVAAGETHVQVSSTLAFGEAPETVHVAAPLPAAAPVKTTALQPPSSPPGVHDLAHAIGSFFRRLFGRKS